MGKSIRSKIKRKHRTEFRNTVGTVAYNKNFEEIHAKLAACIEKQSTSMEGLSKVAAQLGGSPEPREADSMMMVDGAVADAEETTTAKVKDLRGMNKAPKRKSRKGRKYSDMLRAKGESKKEKKEKPKPKYFCQF